MGLQFSFGPVVIPESFAIQIWVKHLGCATPLSNIRTIFTKVNHLSLIYNASINGYSISIQNAARLHTVSNNTKPSVSFNKWIHLTATNDAKRGFMLLKYGSDIILQDSYVDILNTNSDFIHLGTSSLSSINRFEGYLRDLRIWKRSLSQAEAKLNYGINLNLDAIMSQLVAYFPMNPLEDGNPPSFSSDMISTMQTVGSILNAEWTDGDPLCGSYQNIPSHYDGIACSGTQ